MRNPTLTKTLLRVSVLAAILVTLWMFGLLRDAPHVGAPNWEEIELRREAAANQRKSEEGTSALAKKLKEDLAKQERDKNPNPSR